MFALSGGAAGVWKTLGKVGIGSGAAIGVAAIWFSPSIVWAASWWVWFRPPAPLKQRSTRGQSFRPDYATGQTTSRPTTLRQILPRHLQKPGARHPALVRAEGPARRVGVVVVGGGREAFER